MCTLPFRPGLLSLLAFSLCRINLQSVPIHDACVVELCCYIYGCYCSCYRRRPAGQHSAAQHAATGYGCHFFVVIIPSITASLCDQWWNSLPLRAHFRCHYLLFLLPPRIADKIGRRVVRPRLTCWQGAAVRSRSILSPLCNESVACSFNGPALELAADTLGPLHHRCKWTAPSSTVVASSRFRFEISSIHYYVCDILEGQDVHV